MYNDIIKLTDQCENAEFTTNGARVYTTSNSALVDMNFKVQTYRNLPASEIISDFMAAYEEDSELALKWLFYARDVRGGLGERSLFRTIINHLALNHYCEIADTVYWIEQFGRWDDYFSLFNTPLEYHALSTMKNQMELDISHLKSLEGISLIWKWLPNINSRRESVRLNAYKIQRFCKLGNSAKEYRKCKAIMNRKLDTVEVKMSNNQWNEIEYEHVPSRAGMRYANAFTMNDHDRYTKYIADVNNGKSKMNSGTLFPYEICNKIQDTSFTMDVDRTFPEYEAMWKSLDRSATFDNTIVVADTSGSMETYTTGAIRASAIACAMAIYFSECITGPYSDSFITFSGKPQFVEFNKDASLVDKMREYEKHRILANTDIIAVFELILNAAIKAELKQSEIPSRILIISDMGFDQGVTNNSYLFDDISEMYKSHGYVLPRVIFWNVCGNNTGIPMIENDQGVALVSGFSQHALKIALSDEYNPLDALKEILNSHRYSCIKIKK